MVEEISHMPGSYSVRAYGTPPPSKYFLGTQLVNQKATCEPYARLYYTGSWYLVSCTLFAKRPKLGA